MRESYKFAGHRVMLKQGVTDPVQGQVVGGAMFTVEDYWDVITGGSWMNANGNPAALHYAVRSTHNSLPIDNEVVYGKIDGLGHLVHVSEIDTDVTYDPS